MPTRRRRFARATVRDAHRREAVMIELQNYLLNPLHVAAVTPTSEATLLRSSSTYAFKVILSGGNELVFQFETAQDARDELARLRQLVDQASTRR